MFITCGMRPMTNLAGVSFFARMVWMLWFRFLVPVAMSSSSALAGETWGSSRMRGVYRESGMFSASKDARLLNTGWARRLRASSLRYIGLPDCHTGLSARRS